MTGFVTWLEDLGPTTAAAVVGGKMARLAELTRIGITVPAGFCIGVDAYRQHCAGSGLTDLIDELSREGDAATASTAIRAAFEAAPILESVRDAVVSAYEELSDRCGEINVPIAVRSSATGEDSNIASFAGAFDTYLGMTGPDRVLDAVRRCWASLFTERAVTYRREHGIHHTAMPMAVGVMELVQARSAGVAFSVHPVTGKRDRAVVEASFGWGEAVVQGLVTPDHIELDKSDARILRYDVATKTVVSAFDFALRRVVETPMPARLQTRRVLDDEQVRAVLDAVLAIERHYGGPVDVEWALDRRRRAGEPVHVLQARPVTVDVAAPEEEPVGWDPVAAFMKYIVGDTSWR